ncbi:MAG: BMP family ABC transporter substrate-binding protein [Synergistaceae bacterium]|jgi:basic membrane protein A|nr:BMP family ABC transporter substrate-binding protein [Synergistaceae bacterium]
MTKKKLLTFFVFFVFFAALALGWALPRRGDDSWSPGLPLPKERVKVGVIYLANPADGGYSRAHDAGILEMQRALGLNDEQIIRKMSVSDLDKPAVELAMRDCVAQGANIIVSISDGYSEACEKLSSVFSNVIFAQVYVDLRNKTNLTHFFGRVYQARYLSGIAAGLRTKTNKIGYVAAMGRENSQVTSGLNAFALGVERVNRRAQVLVKVTRRWYDPMGETEAARALIAEGCDVLAQHCDTPNPQIAAQAAGLWGVGYNTDMSRVAPGAVITSVLWNWGVYYTRLVQSVIDGTFTTAPYFGGLKDGVVDLAPLKESLLPDGAAEAVAEARREIESGVNGVFDGLMETNEGRTVGVEGGTLSDAVICDSLDWYYRNVREIR